MAENANYRIGTYDGQPHFQCLLCPRDSFDESAMNSHLIQEHQQEPKGVPDDRPPPEAEQESSTASTTAATPTGQGAASAQASTTQTDEKATDRGESSAKRKER